MTLEDQKVCVALGIFAITVLVLWISRNIIWRNAGFGPWAKTVNGDQVGRYDMATMTINGRTITGKNIQMFNGRILVDGKDITDDTGVNLESILEIKITGDIQNLTTDKSVTVNGNVGGDVHADGSVSCGDVGGNISSGGSISADDVKGNVKAGGSVSCDDVGGYVQAGGSVNHG